MVNILFIGNYPPPFSGQSIAFKTLIDGYSIEHNNFYLINTIEKSNKRGVFSRLFDYLRVLIKILYYLTTKKIHTVYHIVSSSNKGFVRDFLIINLTKLFGKKIILHSHNGNYDLFYATNSLFFQNIIRYTINKADKIILLSYKLRNTFSFINEDSKFSYIPNGLPLNSNEVKKNNNKSYISVLFLSNLIESKGYLDILKAIIILKEQGTIAQFHFNFAGMFMLNHSQDVSYKTIEVAQKLFFELIESNNLKEFVTFHGVVHGVEKEQLLKNSDVFLLPTYYNIEAQPITIIEAMAYGCAIYSTNYRAISDMLLDGVNGEFVEPRNPKSIALKLNQINKHKLLEYSKKSVELYEKGFTQKEHLRKMFKILSI